MARSTNILLACVAMLAAMLLAVVLTPHRLMARTHDVFDIEKHLPTAFGDWKPVAGLNVVAPAPPDSLEREVYNQEASRGFIDPEGHVVMLMVAYGESQSDRLQLHHPEVCYTAQGFRVSKTSAATACLLPLRAAAQSDPARGLARGAPRADQLLDADRLRQFKQQLGPPGAEARIWPEGMDSRRRVVPGVDPRHPAGGKLQGSG